MGGFFKRRRFLSAFGLGVLAAPLAARGAGASRAGTHPGGAGSEAAVLEPGELRDRFEIRELLERYSHTVDFMDWERLDTVFTADATVDYSALKDSFGDWPYFARGMEEIRRLYEIVIPPNYGTLHHMSNHLIALHGDEARVRAGRHRRRRAGRSAVGAAPAAAAPPRRTYWAGPRAAVRPSTV